MEFDYRKLRGRIVEKFGTISGFAETLGVSKQAVSRKLNNKDGFTRDKILEWSDVLEIPSEDYAAYFFTQRV